MDISMGIDLFENWDVQTLSSITLCLLTFLLACFTKNLATEAKKTREQAIGPNIVVTLEPSDKSPIHTMLIIENIGSGAAYNISIKEKGDYQYHHQNKNKEIYINNLGLMNIKVLKPNQKIEHLFLPFKELDGYIFRFEIKTYNALGQLVECYNEVDLNTYVGCASWEKKTFDDLVNVLDKVSKQLNKRLKVDIYDSKNREKERIQRDNYIKERNVESN